MNRIADQIRDCRKTARIIIPALRRVAERYGYAIGVHGSLESDIDLIACPWTENAKPAEELKDAIAKALESITGMGYVHPEEAEHKPHGRLAWAIHTGGCGPYVDLSIMPRIEKEKEDGARTNNAMVLANQHRQYEVKDENAEKVPNNSSVEDPE